MKILYRISESSNAYHTAQRSWQVKLPTATKQRCLLNVMQSFPSADIAVFADAVSDDTWDWLRSLERRIVLNKIHAGSEAKSFRELLTAVRALEDDAEVVLLQEDDYLYLPGSEQALTEALAYSHYATCYLHPDKFWHPDRGGNPGTPADNISEQTQVIKTNSHFWMLTNSTTATFATTVGILKEDMDEWMWGTEDLMTTNDFGIFLKLREKGRSLLQPVPSLATHCLKGFEAPLAGLSIASWEDV